MADKGFRLTVLTEEKAVINEDATSLIAPGSEGYLGILRDHAPLATVLIPGKLTVRGVEGRERIFAVSGGFLEVSNNVVTILADAIEAPEDIDFARARAAAERARRREHKAGGVLSEVRAEAALKRALNRMKLAHHAETSHPD